MKRPVQQQKKNKIIILHTTLKVNWIFKQYVERRHSEFSKQLFSNKQFTQGTEQQNKTFQ
jgi:hypothetical protein